MPSVDNLIQGVGYLYIATFGATEPADNALGDAPPSGDWTNLGFTMDGVTLNVTQEYSQLTVDQLADEVDSRIISRQFRISTNLAEATLESLNYALNSNGVLTPDNTAASASGSGTDKFEPSEGLTSTAPTYKALIFDGVAPSGLVRRVIVRRALQVGEIEVEYKKDGQTVFPVEFAAHYVSPSVRPYKIVDQTAVPTA